MNDPIIDRIDAVQLFMELIDPISPQRFLRLLGEAKIGKSHLLTRIFPKIAAEQGFDCVVLDLRNQQITIVEHLHQIRNNLGRDRFVHFDAAYLDTYTNCSVLITGGLGFIGSNLARRLVDLGASVMLVDSAILDHSCNRFAIQHGFRRFTAALGILRDHDFFRSGLGYSVPCSRQPDVPNSRTIWFSVDVTLVA